MKILTIDLGGTAVKAAMIENGVLSDFRESPSNGKAGADSLMDALFHAAGHYADYDAVGISTTGQVNSESGIIVYANKNVPGYTGTNLQQLAQQRLGVPVVIENDVNAAALGEARFGAGKGADPFLCLTYGTGVGGGLILNNRLYTGSDGVAGEVGHILTHPEGLPCACGMRGCYEQYASVTALVCRAMEIDQTASNGRIIFEKLHAGNLGMKQLVKSWVQEITYGLITLIHTLNPSCIALGGGIMEQEYLVKQITESVSVCIMPSYRGVTIRRAELGNLAGLYGMYSLFIK